MISHLKGLLINFQIPVDRVLEHLDFVVYLVEHKPLNIIEKHASLVLVIVELQIKWKINEFVLVQNITVETQVINAILVLTEDDKKATHVNAEVRGARYIQYFHYLAIVFIYHCDHVLVFQVNLGVVAFDLVNFVWEIQAKIKLVN